jgi:hypothetical protein
MRLGRLWEQHIERAPRSCGAARDRLTAYVGTDNAAESRHRSIKPAAADGRLRIFSINTQRMQAQSPFWSVTLGWVRLPSA